MAEPAFDTSWIDELERENRVVLGGAIGEFLAYDRLQDYTPYPKQLEFHAMGRTKSSRLLRAGNQLGKSFAIGGEGAMHLTGEYPKWWNGRRWNRPITAWACGQSATATRDNIQRILLGEIGRPGTGSIPKRCLTDVKGMAKGVSNLYDFIRIRHKSGGTSMLKFKFYEQDRTVWQGPPIDLILFDEEPPIDMYNEGLARTIATHGSTMMAFTPMMGRSEVVLMYIVPTRRGNTRSEVKMTIYDAPHVQDIESQIEKFPEHEREARIMGEPMMGEGLIYPLADTRIVVDDFEVPAWWPQLGALDFGGYGDPTAAVMLAHDRDKDIVYVTNEYKQAKRNPQEHSLTLRAWGKHNRLRWSWPKDGHQKEKSSGDKIAKLYADGGLRMLPDHARYPKQKRKSGRRDTSAAGDSEASRVSRERGITDVLERMMSDRFKVFRSCAEWQSERRVYHRKHGRIVEDDDHLMDATRYGIMSLRFFDRGFREHLAERPPPDWRTTW